MIIAIDGHSSCGKSTVAKELAKRLHIAYVDTGAMYRTVTLFALRRGFIKGDECDIAALESSFKDIHITFDFNPETGSNATFLNGENVEREIRGLEVSGKVSMISAIPQVRRHLVEWQREMGKSISLVMDGRDIGTVVFPNAEIKIFMTASDEVRAQRRYDEMISKGETPLFEEVLQNVRERDRIDSTREESPLRKADDAVLLDNSNLTREEQFEWIIEYIEMKKN
ncbi:MAG: (d)CMP kinase [Marinilabiliaceae bacterium]|nr:(d)CMP kinase [Marinilabiliaceae bacterium]